MRSLQPLETHSRAERWTPVTSPARSPAERPGPGSRCSASTAAALGRPWQTWSTFHIAARKVQNGVRRQLRGFTPTEAGARAAPSGTLRPSGGPLPVRLLPPQGGAEAADGEDGKGCVPSGDPSAFPVPPGSVPQDPPDSPVKEHEAPCVPRGCHAEGSEGLAAVGWALLSSFPAHQPLLAGPCSSPAHWQPLGSSRPPI